MEEGERGGENGRGGRGRGEEREGPCWVGPGGGGPGGNVQGWSGPRKIEQNLLPTANALAYTPHSWRHLYPTLGRQLQLCDDQLSEVGNRAECPAGTT